MSGLKVTDERTWKGNEKREEDTGDGRRKKRRGRSRRGRKVR